MFYLKSDRLRVEIAEPGEGPNNMYRFDRAGFVTEVVLDDDMRFCASEPRTLRHPSSKGRGFCSCFRVDGFNDTAVGEYFPKMGVGLLRKPDEEKFIQFNHYDEDFIPYEIVTTVEFGKATFETLPMPCQGYAFHHLKTVEVRDNVLTLSMQVANVGEKEIPLVEYCHNFISIDGMAVGPNYLIEIPGLEDQGMERKLDAERGDPTNFCGNGQGYVMYEYTRQDRSVRALQEVLAKELPFVWRVKELGAKAYVEGHDSFVPAQVKIWSCDHMVCPEIFYETPLKPGETKTWTRTLIFDYLDDLL